MAGVFRLYNNLTTKRILQSSLINKRFMSASNKESKVAGATTAACPTEGISKNWVSYGFDFKNEAADKIALHSVFFCAITLCMVVGGFVWMYVPDYQYRDWAQREAFLELRRREKSGLPLVDPNLIDPKNIKLPSDEDLGDKEIII